MNTIAASKHRILPLFLSTFTLFTGLWLATAAQAATFPVNQCAGDRFGSNLGCTANDVSITGMAVVGDTTSCIGGSNVTLDLQLTVNFQNPDRYDIGIFISNDGKDPQTTSASGGATSCSVSVLPNSSPFYNLDGPTDTCGDGGSSLSGIHYMSDVTVPCQSLPGASGSLYIPFVVSWDVNKTSPGAVCTSNANPVPGAQSKCNAPTIVQGSVAVVVLPSITKSDGISTLFSGDITSYVVTISNTTGATLSGAVFKDAAVTGITANSVSCSVTGGASCPASSTVAAMQGAGITIPSMPAASSVTFTIGATLTGSPGDTRTNTATVTVGSQTNTAADSNIIVDSIAILPTTQSLNGDKGSTATYSYTLYNYGVSTDTITLAAVSSLGWTAVVSPTSVSVPAGGSSTVTLTVTIPSGASIGAVDTTTITATSGNTPGKTATATAITTVTTVLTLTPSNTGSGGAGASVYYSHRVQSNAATSKTVSLTPVFSGCTGTWTSALYQSDKTTALSSPVTLAANGGYLDFVLKVTVPVGAAASSTCTVTLTAKYTSGAANTVSVTDVTTVKNLVLYEDTGYTTEQTTYPVGNSVYAKGFGLTSTTSYQYRWYDASGTEVCTPRAASTTGTTFPDTCVISSAGPLGTWTAQIWNVTTNALFVQSNFYVGPDHLSASYSGTNPANTDTDTVIDLALHDKLNHVVPFDSLGNLVKGSPTDTEGPLMITVTVSGSASIVSTTLSGAVITGQSVTGKLDSTLGTATLTIRDSVAETVTVTPVSYKGVLYNSPASDESATLSFAVSAPHHLEIQHGSGAGLTCAASTLTVKACADAACATAYSGGISGTLSATGTPAVNWDGTTGGAAGAGFVIASGSSSVTKNVQIATAGEVTFGIASSSPAPSNATICSFGTNLIGNDNCVFTAGSAGFIFSSTTTGNTYTIPAQISGIATGTLYLRAVEASTANPAVCTPAIISSTSTVEMGYSCNNPLSCQPGSLVFINAAAIAPAGTSLSLTFDADGAAPVTVRYDDVGEISLSANKTAIPFLSGTSVTLSGSSNAFVVAPHHFGFSGVTVAPIKAGEDFAATVTAYNGLASPTATANFGQETAPETVTLSFSKCQPTGTNSVNGTFSGSVGAFSGGAASASNLNWNEVGNGDLVATLSSGSYLASSLTATGNSGTGGSACNGAGNVGSFIPDHFDTVLSGPMTCPSGLICPSGGLAYSAQPFTIDVYARNVAGVTTQNYDGTANTSPNFAKSVTLTAWDALGSTTTQNPPSATPGAITANTLAASAFSRGATVSPGTPAAPIYTFGTSPTAPTDIYIRAVDAGGVTSLRALANTSVEGGIKVVSGRLKVSNAYGSELLPLTLTATAQYYDSSATEWANCTTDNVSNLVLAASYAVGAGATAVTLTPASGDLLNGVLNIGLSKPTAGAGTATISPTTPGYLPLATSGTATFGIYNSNNNYIYRRESY